MIVLSCVMKARPGKEAELETLLKALFPKVKEEAGVVEYVLHRAQEDAGKFFFYEKYRDQKALDEHSSTPYLQQLFAQLEGVLEGPPALESYEDIASIIKG